MPVDQKKKWLRDNQWRQGQVLAQESVRKLQETGVVADNPNGVVVVISHDCDLANDNLYQEPNVEVIEAEIIRDVNGTLTFAKSSRTLHFEFNHEGEKVFVELRALNKKQISKVDMLDLKPDQSYTLDVKSLKLLQHWLSVRYKRSSFSNEFVNLLNSSGMKDKLAKQVRKYSDQITGVYFDVDEGQQIDHFDGSPFKLSIVISTNADRDFQEGAELESAITDLFSEKFFSADQQSWKDLEFLSCIIIREDEFTVDNSRKLKHWDFDHLSFRGEEVLALPA